MSMFPYLIQNIMRMIDEVIRNPPDISDVHISKKMNINDDQERVYTEYIDIPLCFDSEVYSFRAVDIEKGEVEKRAVMWAWGLAIGDTCYMGRTWDELVSAMDALVKAWNLSEHRRIICWVHNLSYDFQFFRKWFKWDNVFALSSREVCYCCTSSGLEFRCSYILTGYSLDYVGKHLTAHSIRKMAGEIDYTIPRHPLTALTDKEIAYLEHDCLVVTAHIAEQIEIEGGLARIPLTKTGYVRREVRKACFRDADVKAKDDFSRIRYGQFIHSLELDSFVYESLYRAFQGGYTHANPFHSGEVFEQVKSYDFASAYPAVMCSELFPITPPQLWDVHNNMDELMDCLTNYCCVFTVTFYNLNAKFNEDHYLSYSHCYIPKECERQISNGRVIKADILTTTITNVDWDIIIRCYSASKIEISGLIRWGKGYLPQAIIKCILKFFKAKTELKKDKSKIVEYQQSKEMLNSIYGMMVQNPLRPIVPYNLDTNEWGEEKDGRILLEIPLTEEEKEINLFRYNTSHSRFTYYAWGVFITAYCRSNLWRGIFHYKNDYLYGDTDSLKVINYDAPEHIAFIDKYNSEIQEKIKKCLRYYRMDESLSECKGKKLGVWEDEGVYTRFKAMRAKCYMTEKPNPKTGGPEVSITISGVNKGEAMPYILSKCAGPMRSVPEGDSCFDFLAYGMHIPAGYTGKMIPYYGDSDITGTVRDRDGVYYEYHEKSYVYMEPGDYTMKDSTDYARVLDLLRRGLL